MLDLFDLAIIAAFVLVLGMTRRRIDARAKREHELARQSLALKKMSIQMREHPQPMDTDSARRR
ncbi:MAG: hypothetical protein ABL907_14495 [Hyphomicrobium sp.]